MPGETQKVGIREFRDNLSSYLLESAEPVAITRHGDTVGVYIPTRPKRTEAQRSALSEAHERLQKIMEEKGITEDDLMNDYWELKAAERKARVAKEG